MIKDNVEYGYEQLHEWASPLKRRQSQIEASSDTYVEHLVKIIIYGESYPETINHWTAEFMAPLKDSVRVSLKSTGKPPEPYQLNKWLLKSVETKEDLTGMINYVINPWKYSRTPREIDSEDVLLKIKQFTSYVTELAYEGKISKDLVDNYVQDILLR
jgi:hypothetical protein